jgi:hypothetical protein
VVAVRGGDELLVWREDHEEGGPGGGGDLRHQPGHDSQPVGVERGGGGGLGVAGQLAVGHGELHATEKLLLGQLEG